MAYKATIVLNVGSKLGCGILLKTQKMSCAQSVTIARLELRVGALRWTWFRGEKSALHLRYFQNRKPSPYESPSYDLSIIVFEGLMG